MTHILANQIITRRNFVWTLLATLALMIGFSFIPIPTTGAGQVQAAGCRVVTNPDEAGRYAVSTKLMAGYSDKRIVPTWSTCHDINVQNIYSNAATIDKHCATFRVRFYPASGGSFDNGWRKVCSKGETGPIVPIATFVRDGTKYRVEYIANGASPNSRAVWYKLID